MADDIYEVSMPKLGESVTEGTLGRWLKEVGDEVAFDDPLFEVSTDKVDSEIPSPYDGTLLEVLVAPGDTVPVGTPLARIGPADAVGTGEHSPVDESVGPPGEIAAPAAAPSSGGEPAGDVHEVRLPKLGESVTEGTVGRWLKAKGDRISFDDPLFEVSTDKVDSEIPSPYDGVLLDVLVAEGETVPVGTVLARIGEPGAAPATQPAAPAPAPAAAAPAKAATATTTVPAAPRPAAGGNGGGGGRLLSPVVRRLAAENNLDLAQVSGTGGGGRIMREDVLAALSAAPAQAVPAQTAPAQTAPAQAAPAQAQAAQPQAAQVKPAADSRDEVVPLSRIRMVTAERMVESRRTSAHVWTSIEVDLEKIEQVRQKHKAAFRKAEGGSLTYLPFIGRAVCDGLRAFPPLNCSIDMDSRTITLHHYVNLGIAVDVPGLGLMAPVISDADGLNLRGLARAIRDVGTRAKDRKLGSADLTGSTFTISNPGPMGTYASAAVINQPNVAILTTEGVARRVVAVGDAIAIHHTCVLGLSYDHRALDGVVAAQFLAYVRDACQDRDWEAELA
jgi:pyruvate dehydrogenase E2 component (dihydrolipoamide acetyltransferase)